MKFVYRDAKFDEEKEIKCSLERELHLHAYHELLTPKEENQVVVETTTQIETSREGWK